MSSRVVKVTSDGYIKTSPHKPNIDAPQRTAHHRVLIAPECGGVTHNLDLPPPVRLSPFLCPPHGQLCAKQDTERGEVNDAPVTYVRSISVYFEAGPSNGEQERRERSATGVHAFSSSNIYNEQCREP